jgi:trafficking protein particle complex subunit 11
VTLASAKIEFDGALKPITLTHLPSTSDGAGSLLLSSLTLQEDFQDSEDDLPTMLRGDTDLTLKPDQTKVVELTIPLREAGEVSVFSLRLSYKTESFDLEYVMALGSRSQSRGWYIQGSAKPRQPRADAHALLVHPRPPKLEISLQGTRTQYYTHESIELKFQLVNAESETASIKLDTHLFGKVVPPFSIKGGDGEQSADAAEDESSIAGLSLGDLTSSSNMDLTLNIEPTKVPISYELHVRATYHLESDPATPIIQMLPVQMAIVSAFEANYDLVPRLHCDPWPSLFDSDNILSTEGSEKEGGLAQGLAQSWCLVCHYASFATEELKVTGVGMEVISGTSSARYTVVNQPEIPETGTVVTPKSMHEARFDLVAQKWSLDDRNPASLDLAFVIRWKRQNAPDDAPVNTTTMVAGHYLVLGSEPRVLASIFETPESKDTGLMHLDITVENPSNHFLTFGLSMDSSDEFAFSGAKQTTVHLLPMSRRTSTYRLLPLVSGRFVRPGLTVRDKYFQKTLRIIPTEGMKIDKDGLLIWVPGSDEAQDADEDEDDESEEE